MTVSIIDSRRIARAKRAFSTRRVIPDLMKTLIGGNVRPLAGDLALARVDELGKQTKLELTDGRRAHMFPGDEIIVSFGNRYAPDQYEAVIGPDMSPCDLVAAGGVAALEVSRHQRMIQPTKITPIGLIGDAAGRRLNLMQFRVDAGYEHPQIPAILSLGTSMNSGKTLTATSLVRGLKRAGHSVAALKVTGTGAGGDMWIVRDAGADIALDFTDAGFATTYLAAIADIERGAFLLMNYAASLGCDLAVIEIADGLQQVETAQLIRSDAIRGIALATVFAACDAMGAKYGVDILRQAGHSVIAMSGLIGRSPLGVREAEAATDLRVYTPWELQEGALVPAIRELAAERYAASGGRSHQLLRIAQTASPARLVPNGYGDAIGEGVLTHGNCGISKSANGHANGFWNVPKPAPDRALVLLGQVAARIMRNDIARLCGAAVGSRAKGRLNRRNGFRNSVWTTVLGPVAIRIPRLRHGCYQPLFLDRALNGDPAFWFNDLDVILRSRSTPALEAELARLIAAIGCEPLEAQEMSALITEVDLLMTAQAEQSSPLGALRFAPSDRLAGAGRPWSTFNTDDIDDEDAPEDARAFGALQFTGVAASSQDDDAEDDRSVGLAFQVPVYAK